MTNDFFSYFVHMKMNRSVLVMGVLSFLLLLAVFMLEYCKPKSEPLTSSNAFVGDKTCQSCHKKEYDLYMQSDHVKAMMPASDSTVLGNFNNISYTADGVTSTFFKKNGKFFIQTQGPDGKNHDYEVLYTFGYKPLQQYLVAFPDGRYQVPRVSWDVVNKKWFHQYGGQKIHHRDWLHWTGAAQNWNTMCASCHSTNLQKNYDLEKDAFHTTWSGVTVSCESCHGPGKNHVDYATNGGYANGKGSENSFLLPLHTSNRIQVNTCAPCHARRSEISADRVDPEELLNTHIPEIPTTEFFHADGQVNDEDYIYTSFLQSKMFHRQVKCSNCHNAHSGQLVKPVTQVCRQCHASTYASIEHTHHTTAQVTCVNCHMPSKVYMGNDLRHDHSFRVPRPDQSVTYSTPNACNNCHTDKSAKWSAAAVVKWFGPQRKYHFSDDLIPGSKGGSKAEAHLQKLWADTSVPDIIKATAIHYLRSVPTTNALQMVKKALAYPDAQVRYRAIQTLSSFPIEQWKDDVFSLLSDKVRSVRMAAADALLLLGDNLPAEYAEAYRKAKKELQDYLLYQADFSVGNVMIGDFYYRQRDLLNAEKFYLRGLKKDSMMNYVRFNLSALYNSQARNNDALHMLNQAKATDPKNPRVYYQLALLQVEMNDQPSALANFAKAVQLHADEPRLYYNYGLLLQQNGKVKDAEQVYIKGLGIDPENIGICYALAVLYIQQGDKSKAVRPATILKKKDPLNVDYQALFKEIGI